LNIGESGGATRQAITKQQLETLEVVLPPIESQEQFVAFVEQVDKSKYIEKISVRVLTIFWQKVYIWK
jgi:type I restriction enzyme S subunit